ncbi:hypothetical protein ACFU6K_26365, partial [Kitasatospora sp. NPDC057512]|uniref:hypothetical protein n=1 Tax=Kitasatospora sp. NPDC057512 TaxID=3346154 RepID=UPI00367C96E9
DKDTRPFSLVHRPASVGLWCPLVAAEDVAVTGVDDHQPRIGRRDAGGQAAEVLVRVGERGVLV